MSTDIQTKLQPLVSVTIPVYNCAEFLAEAIESALAQDYPRFEVIVGDDGSTDHSLEIARRYNVRIVQHEKNRGLGAMRNTLFKSCAGGLVALLDADDVWLPGKISRQVTALLANPKASFCHTGTVLFGEQTGDGPIGAEIRARIQGECFEEQFFRSGVVESAALMWKHLIPPHGCYEHICECFGLWIQMAFQHEVVYLPEVLVKYRRRAGQITSGGNRRGQIYSGWARLKTLDYLGHQLAPAQLSRLKSWAIDELLRCTYSRYWQRDYRLAQLGFRLIQSYGGAVPLRHRVAAAVGSLIRK